MCRGGRHAGATVPSPVMPARCCIAASIAAPAFAAPAAASAQSGDGGGAPAPGQTSASAQSGGQAQAQAPQSATLPRTGFDVLPVAAAGLVLLLGGLALWRRPHADR
jgi:LPXTG-motif cell wall-anchored protein